MNQVYGVNEWNRPINIHVTKWSSDPNTFGSYSFYPPKAYNNSDFEDLLRPLSSEDDGRGTHKKIFFAGEAYDYKYSGYVHGAYLSAEKTAMEIH